MGWIGPGGDFPVVRSLDGFHRVRERERESEVEALCQRLQSDGEVFIFFTSDGEVVKGFNILSVFSAFF